MDATPEDLSREERSNPSQRGYLFETSFLGEGLDAKLGRLFKRCGLPVRIVHESLQLQQAVKSAERATNECKFKWCKIRSNICFMKMVVYLVVCETCREKYVGSTERCLHTRIREHYYASSAIKQHKVSCPGELFIRVSILAKARDVTDLMIKEAFYQRKLVPKLNRCEEIRMWEGHVL